MKLFFRILLILGIYSLTTRSFAQPQVSYIGENAPLPFGQGENWGTPYAITEREEARWVEIFPFVSSLLDLKKINALSPTFKELMQKKNYSWQPKLVPLRVWAVSADAVIYEATLDELPAPPAVERDLKVYILGLRVPEQLLLPNHFAFTIKGARFE